jgi:hypothetical protein
MIRERDEQLPVLLLPYGIIGNSSNQMHSRVLMKNMLSIYLIHLLTGIYRGGSENIAIISVLKCVLAFS